MNEVYKVLISWFPRKFFYRFSGRIGTFYRRKIDSYEKKNSVGLPWFHGCRNENFVRTIFGRCFQVREFSFCITEGTGLTGISFHFWPQKQISSGSSHTIFWLLLSILKSILYGVYTPIESLWAQKRNLLVMKCL
jgi:hypothetical protein